MSPVTGRPEPLLDGRYWDVTEPGGWTRHHENCWTPEGDES